VKVNKDIENWWLKTYGKPLNEKTQRELDQMFLEYGYIGASYRHDHDPYPHLEKMHNEFIEKELKET